MFTKKDKIKELTEYSIKKPATQFCVSKNNKYPQIGVSIVVNCTYANSDDDIMVTYKKHFVECYDMAKSMNLVGCEQHNKLVRGSGVNVISKHFAPTVFYGKSAYEIIDACESGRDLQSYIDNQLSHQR